MIRADANSIDLAHKVIEACLDGLEPVAIVPDATLPVGTYLSQRTARVIELLTIGEMRLGAVDGGMPMPIVPHPGGVWRLAPMFSLLKQAFKVEAGSVRFSDFGNDDVLEKIESAGQARLGARAGRYRCDALGVTVDLFEEDGRVRLETHGRHGGMQYDLAPLTSHVLRAKCRLPLLPLGGIVTFAEGRHGFLLTGDRMRRIRFERNDS